MPDNIANIYKNPTLLLQNLIRFDTTNPPGNEIHCIEYIETLIKAAGIETTILSELPNRSNLIARIKGSGKTSPLLMYGHVDVVTTENQDWKYPPFEGIIAEECIWGRGTVDMKGGVTMMLASFLKLKMENITPPGDVILALVSDEEVGNYGAKFLVEKYPQLFETVKYAIGEFGGFTLYIGEKKFYPIMVSEKQLCPVKATFKGKGGHGSLPSHNNAMSKAGQFLTMINKKRLPVHITLAASEMITAMAKNLPFPQNMLLKQLLNPAMTDNVLKLMGKSGIVFDPLFHNTINATIINGGNKINVIPGEVVIHMDGRLLPGEKPGDFIKELYGLGDENAEFEIIEYEAGPNSIDMGLFEVLNNVLKELDPQGIPMPLLVSGVTDARYFSKLGITTYGFTPMLLSKDIDFTELMHGANERIPIKALEFGTSAIFKLLNNF